MALLEATPFGGRAQLVLRFAETLQKQKHTFVNKYEFPKDNIPTRNSNQDLFAMLYIEHFFAAFYIDMFAGKTTEGVRKLQT